MVVLSIYISISLGLMGVGCSAQVKMVPIACASLVANATGPKVTRANPCYTFFCILLIILAAIYPKL